MQHCWIFFLLLRCGSNIATLGPFPRAHVRRLSNKNWTPGCVIGAHFSTKSSQHAPRPEGLLQYSSTTFKIPSLNTSRRPANIPLRTLSSTASSSHHNSASLLGANVKPGRSSLSYSSDSAASDISYWSDTGDLGEQLTEVEDPLKIKLRGSLDRGVFGGSSRRQTRPKRAKYQEDSFHNEIKDDHAGLVKEGIAIPIPGPRKISRAENIIASIMAGGERQMHGLTGRPLVYGISK
jgi:hypothetical protein